MQLRGMGYLQLHGPLHGLRRWPQCSGHQVRGQAYPAILASVHLLHETHCCGRVLPSQLQAGIAALIVEPRHGWPCSCVPALDLWHAGLMAQQVATACCVLFCKTQGTLQFVIAKPFLAFFTLGMFVVGKYQVGNYSWNDG